MSEYRTMWAELGLDLAKHDQLLNALPGLHQAIFLEQEGRPKAMGYFDFVVGQIHGLRVKELVDAQRAGAKVVGTYCVFVPEDLILAAGAIPVGLCAGAQFSIPDAEDVLPRSTCPLIKSSFGFRAGRTCPYTMASDLIVGETTCDGKKKMYEILGAMQPTYVMEVPQKRGPADVVLFEKEMRAFLGRLEALTGRAVTADALEEEIARIEAKKATLRRLARLRAARPAPISGLDALLVNQISFYDDADRFTAKVNDLAGELEARIGRGEGVAPAEAPRILVAGSPMAIPNWKLHRVVEDLGGVVVGEESCTGSRYFETTTPRHEAVIESQLDAIARRQLDTHCACFTPNEERLADIVRMASSLGADAVIQYNLQFCQIFAMEAVGVGRSLDQRNVPSLQVEDNYGAEDMGQLRTRVEAFLEMLRGRSNLGRG